MTLVGAFVVVVSYLLGVGCTTPPQSGRSAANSFTISNAAASTGRNSSPQRAPAQADSTRPIVEMGCSETTPRNPIATVRYRLQSATALTNSHLEATVFKDGFQTGRFASTTLSRGDQRKTLQMTPGLKEAAPQSFAFQVVNVTMAGDTVVVRIEQLEPGINYLWRVVEQGPQGPLASQVTRAQAVACPYDEPPPR